MEPKRSPTTPLPAPETQQTDPAANTEVSANQLAIRAAMRSPFTAINIIGGLTLGLTALFVISESIFPDSAGVAGLALVPMTALIVGGAAIYDVVYLSSYIVRHRHDGASKRRDWAFVGVCVALALLTAIGLAGYSDFQGLYYDKEIQHNQGVSQDQTLMNMATAAGYGFDLLTPTKLPPGYTLYMAQVANDANAADSVALTEQYQSASGTAVFDLVEFSAARRLYYAPPASCGYYLGPSDDPAINRKVYPCPLVGQTAGGSKVYWYAAVDENGETNDAYFTTTGRDIVLMSVLKRTGAPTRSQVLTTLSSLAPDSLSEIIKRNAAAAN